MNINKFNNKVKVIASEVLDDYIIKYLKYKNTFFIDVIIFSNNKGHFISDFLSNFININDIQEDIIDAINQVLNMELLNEVISAETLYAYVENENTYFIGDEDLTTVKERASKNAEMFISTLKFKEISIKWLEFLESQK